MRVPLLLLILFMALFTLFVYVDLLEVHSPGLKPDRTHCDVLARWVASHDEVGVTHSCGLQGYWGELAPSLQVRAGESKLVCQGFEVLPPDEGSPRGRPTEMHIHASGLSGEVTFSLPCNLRARFDFGTHPKMELFDQSMRSLKTIGLGDRETLEDPFLVDLRLLWDSASMTVVANDNGPWMTRISGGRYRARLWGAANCNVSITRWSVWY